jgi:hypothetical protein
MGRDILSLPSLSEKIFTLTYKNLTAMKTKYQVQSKFKGDSEWLEDHLPFDSRNEAIEYIKTQPKCFEYRIIVDEYEEE